MNDVRAVIVGMLAEGRLTYSQAAALAGVSKQAVAKWAAHLPGSQADRCMRAASRTFYARIGLKERQLSP